MSTNLLGSSPAVGFEEPFQMLEACHERVVQRLDLLSRLEAHLQVHGPDAQARSAALDVLRYFDLAAPHHHEDEERHVIPLLRAKGHDALAERLLADHQHMHEGWLQLRPALAAIERGESTGLPARWRDWAALYADHIRVEEQEAYRVGDALTAAQRLVMGDEMAARRRGPPRD